MSEPTRRLSNIKWQATGVDGHTYHTCGEWQYTSDAPPVEADEYERMKARAETAETAARVPDMVIDGYVNYVNLSKLIGNPVMPFSHWLAEGDKE